MQDNDRFLTFINSSIVEEIGWTSRVQIVYVLETILLFSNWIQYIFVLYLMLRFRAMHRNLQILLILYGGQYFFSMLSRTILIYYQFQGSSFANFPVSGLFSIANYSRTTCLFTAFGMLPFFVFERCFATCFAGTYENNRHIWIPLILILFMIPLNFFSAMAYIRSWVPIHFHCVGFLAVNIGGSILLVIITKCNIRLHNTYANLESSGYYHYSLSERFQVSENIKTCCWLSRIQVSIIFFNIVCSLILMLEYFTVEHRTMIIVYSAFNIMCTLYAMIVPIVVIYYTPEWARESVRLYNKIFSRKTVAHSHLRSTFGEEMVYADKNVESKLYFDQLQKDLTKQKMDEISQQKKKSISYPNSLLESTEIFL